MRSYTISATALADSYVTINGNKKSFAGISLNKTSSSLTDTLLTTHTVTVEHNSDGKKSITIKANLEFNGTVSGKYLSDVTASKTVDLDNIPRASGLTVASSINTGASLTATITPANSTFTHKIEYYVGNSLKANSGSIAAGTNTYSRTIEHSWFPSDNSATLTVRLLTYNSGTEVGRVDKAVIATVPSTIIPTVNSITPTLVNGLGGYYVEGKSQVQLTVSATAGTGSTLSSYVFGGQNISGNNSTTTSTSAVITSGVIRANGTLTYGVIAKDGRPNRQSVQKTTSITVYPYANPQISSITAQRCLSDGTLSSDGTYAKITLKTSYSPVNGANTRVVTLYSSKDNYTTGTVALAATNTSDTYTGVYGSGFAIGSNYIIRAVITDKYNTGTTIQKSVTLQMAQRAVNIAKYGNGVAIGGFSSVTDSSSSGLFQSHWDAQFKKNVKVDGILYCNGVVQTKGATKISDNSDFNNLREPGSYIVGSTSAMATMSNRPADAPGKLVVSHITGSAYDGSAWSYLLQEFTTIYSHSYQRLVYTEGTPNEWKFTEWRLVAGDMPRLLEGSGYQKLPSGVIIQWGSGSLAASTSYVAITFPIAFPTRCFSVICQNAFLNSRDIAYSIAGANQNGFSAYPFTSTGVIPTVASAFYWIAIGY
jgi:hypothetical protein